MFRGRSGTAGAVHANYNGLHVVVLPQTAQFTGEISPAHLAAFALTFDNRTFGVNHRDCAGGSTILNLNRVFAQSRGVVFQSYLRERVISICLPCGFFKSGNDFVAISQPVHQPGLQRNLGADQPLFVHECLHRGGGQLAVGGNIGNEIAPKIVE